MPACLPPSIAAVCRLWWPIDNFAPILLSSFQSPVLAVISTGLLAKEGEKVEERNEEDEDRRTMLVDACCR